MIEDKMNIEEENGTTNNKNLKTNYD